MCLISASAKIPFVVSADYFTWVVYSPFAGDGTSLAMRSFPCLTPAVYIIFQDATVGDPAQSHQDSCHPECSSPVKATIHTHVQYSAAVDTKLHEDSAASP
eukprot:scaffold153833_cov37-Prasinocladus_malaysianus.AAC.1